MTPEMDSVDHNCRQKIRQKWLVVSFICFVLAPAAVLFEAFAVFSIQFCDGEDLMILYWGFWTLIQVGPLIGILGIILNRRNVLSRKEHPPWNTALGTSSCDFRWWSPLVDYYQLLMEEVEGQVGRRGVTAERGWNKREQNVRN